MSGFLCAPFVTPKCDEFKVFYLSIVDVDAKSFKLFTETAGVGVNASLNLSPTVVQNIIGIIVNRLKENRKKKCPIQNITDGVEELKKGLAQIMKEQEQIISCMKKNGMRFSRE